MNIIVLHGDDTTKSYERLTKFIDTAKKRGWDTLYDTFPNTPSLFGIDRLIIYKDYTLLTQKDIKNFDKFDGTLVIYHESVLPLTFIKQMPKDFKLETFELPKILFVFLESFYPKNTKRAIELLHKLTEKEPTELVFFMLVRHIKELYTVKIDPKTKVFPSWKLSKLSSQANKFEEGKLIKIIDQMAKIDILVKTTRTNLLKELDLLIVKQLE